MLEFLKLLWNIFKQIWGSKYKWMLILYAVWIYRLSFIADTGGGIGKILQVGCIAGLLFYLNKFSKGFLKRPFQTNGAVKSCMFLYLFALLSTAWAFLPTFAFFLSFQNLLMIMLFVWIFSQCNTFKTTEKAFLYCALFTLIFENMCCRIVEGSLFTHFLPGGSVSAMLLAYCTGEYLNMKRGDSERKTMLLNTMLLSAFFLVVNTSGGANASALFGIGVGMFFGGKRAFAVMLMIAGGILFYNRELFDELLLFIMPGKNMETIEIGNGRDYIWERLMNLHEEKPWLGWGFACVERVDQDIFDGQSLSDAHNSYIGILGSLGYVGCGFLGLHLLQMFGNTFGRFNRWGFNGLFAAFCCACLNSYTYGFLSGKTCSITVVYLMLVCLSYCYNKVKVYE